MRRKPTMSWIGFMMLAPCCLSLTAGQDRARVFPFTKADVGKVPAGWKAAQTGKGQGSVWKVVADSTAPSGRGYVLAQTAESPGGVFNICVAGDTQYRDVELSVSFKAIAGEGDQ